MIRRMTISPEFILLMGPRALVSVVAEPVPLDAKIVGKGYDADRDEFYVDVDSGEFTDQKPLTPVMRRLDGKNLEDRETMRELLAKGAGA